MIIDNKEVHQLVLADAEGEVLAVISDENIIEKDGVSVVVDWG